MPAAPWNYPATADMADVPMNSRTALSRIAVPGLVMARPKLACDVRARIRCESDSGG